MEISATVRAPWQLTGEIGPKRRAALVASRVPQSGGMPQSPSVDAQCFLIVGAAMQVHRVLGCGFLEAVYRAALAVEFLRRGIPFLREVSYPISYGGEPLHLSYRADFVCFSSVIVEVKALSAIGNIELAQAINYLKVSRLERGLILNFGAPSLQFRRVVLTNRGKSGPAAS